MRNQPQPYQFDYQKLDSFLKNYYDPTEVGNQLDETMCDLVSYVSKDDAYCQTLPERHSILRELRDIFWRLKKV